MLSTFICLAGLITPTVQDASPRLRTQLPSGAQVLVEAVPDSTYTSVQLLASSRYCEESQATHGRRHLLEHFVAKGTKRDLDARLESQGMFLNARTLRDAMVFEVICKPKQLALAMDAIKEFLNPVFPTDVELRREIAIMEQELSLLPNEDRLSSAAWRFAFGEAGLDPQGSMDSIKTATVASLRALYKRQFNAQGLVLSICGPVDVDAAMRAGQAVMQVESGPKLEPAPSRPEGVSGRVVAEDAFGEARGAFIASYRDPSAAGALAAALAIGSEFPDAFVFFTPSTSNSLIIVGRVTEPSGLGLRIDSMTDIDLSRLFPIGKELARQWYRRSVSPPRSLAWFRGMLALFGANQRPETLLQQIDSLTESQFRTAFDRFRKANAVIVVGGKTS